MKYSLLVPSRAMMVVPRVISGCDSGEFLQTSLWVAHLTLPRKFKGQGLGIMTSNPGAPMSGPLSPAVSPGMCRLTSWDLGLIDIFLSSMA